MRGKNSLQGDGMINIFAGFICLGFALLSLSNGNMVGFYVGLVCSITNFIFALIIKAR